MNENKSVMVSLGEYMNEIFDKDGDGIVTVKEIFTVFPNSAIAIAVIFVDLLVAIAEYRVWDFGMTVTGDGWKALGFVAISAVPFYLGQILWLYPLGNFFQKSIAVVFVGLALYTSWLFGTADLTLQYDIKLIAKYLQDLTVGYVVGTLVYISVDTTVKADRQKIKAQRKAAWQTELNKIARTVLSSLRGTLEEQRDIEQEFGAAQVTQAMNALGRKKPKQQNQNTPPVRPRFSQADYDIAAAINPMAAPYRSCPQCKETVPLSFPKCPNCDTVMPALSPNGQKVPVGPTNQSQP